MWKWLVDLIGGLAAGFSPLERLRSPQWPKVRADYLKVQPDCQVCGTTDGVEVHHCIPFHIDKTLELMPTNLITLCRPHHFFVGHLGSWASWNPEVREDCRVWRKKIQNRPRG